MKAKINANAPMEATSACAMWVQVVIKSWMGVMSGPAAEMACPPPAMF
jgi:hypothetical protein